MATTTRSSPALSWDAARATKVRPAPATTCDPNPGEGLPIGMSGRITRLPQTLPSDEDGKAVAGELHLHLGAIVGEIAVAVDRETRAGGAGFPPRHVGEVKDP